MKIDSVAVAFPSRILTNNDVIELIHQHSQSTYNGDLNHALTHVLKLLRFTGAQTRRMLAAGETPIKLINQAVDDALAQAGCDKRDIDLLIYVGVGRGFAEPASSYLVAQALDMNSVECFDILDACNSWSRALQIVHSLLRTKRYRRAMIVNGEFNCSEGWVGNLELFRLTCMEQLEWTFPAYTIGEAATATILSPALDRTWEFHFSSRPDLADLCTVPISGYEGYCRQSDRIGKNGVLKFTSFGRELFDAARPELIRIFRQLTAPIDKISAIFPHAASQRTANEIADELGVRHLIWNVYEQYGNLVSASVPAAMATAISAQRVRRGDLLAGAVASAGMSFAVYSFTF